MLLFQVFNLWFLTLVLLLQRNRDKLTLTPTVPFMLTSSALINFFSISEISGSLTDLPTNRLRDPMVFLKLETSWVFALSPIERCLGPKETKDLICICKQMNMYTRLEHVRGCAIRHFISDDVDSSMPGYADLVERRSDLGRRGDP